MLVNKSLKKIILKLKNWIINDGMRISFGKQVVLYEIYREIS